MQIMQVQLKIENPLLDLFSSQVYDLFDGKVRSRPHFLILQQRQNIGQQVQQFVKQCGCIAYQKDQEYHRANLQSYIAIINMFLSLFIIQCFMNKPSILYLTVTSYENMCNKTTFNFNFALYRNNVLISSPSLLHV